MGGESDINSRSIGIASSTPATISAIGFSARSDEAVMRSSRIIKRADRAARVRPIPTCAASAKQDRARNSPGVGTEGLGHSLAPRPQRGRAQKDMARGGNMLQTMLRAWAMASVTGEFTRTTTPVSRHYTSLRLGVWTASRRVTSPRCAISWPARRSRPSSGRPRAVFGTPVRAHDIRAAYYGRAQIHAVRSRAADEISKGPERPLPSEFRLSASSGRGVSDQSSA